MECIASPCVPCKISRIILLFSEELRSMAKFLFDELNADPILLFSSIGQTFTLGGETPYKVFLKKGKNVLGIEANDSPYHSAIEKIKKVLIDINVLVPGDQETDREPGRILTKNGSSRITFRISKSN